MILGTFDDDGRPYVQGRLFVPSLRVNGYVDFLIDTGADFTGLHPRDGVRLGVPFPALRHPMQVGGIGGEHTYFVEQNCVILFNDGTLLRMYVVPIAIARPDPKILALPSVLGRPLLNNWHLRLDPLRSRIEIVARNAALTLQGDVSDIPSPSF